MFDVGVFATSMFEVPSVQCRSLLALAYLDVHLSIKKNLWQKNGRNLLQPLHQGLHVCPKLFIALCA
jgi:hypothetical protein